MILQSLKLENIRSYTSELIEFPRGSVMLSGDIGSGKSTILLAIEFALFGIMRSDLSGEMLLRHGKLQGAVELKFEIGDDEYIVRRSLKKVKGSVVQDTGYIITNGRKYEGTPVELKAKIIEILGYPEDLITKSKSPIYRYTVYTPQEEMKRILFEDKDIRLDTLRKLFGLDKYKIIRENSALFIRETRKKQEILSAKLETADELEADKKTKLQRTEVIDKEIHRLKDDELMNLMSEIDERKKEIEGLDRELKLQAEIKKDLDVIDSMISANRALLDSLHNKINDSKRTKSNLEKKLEEFKNLKEVSPEKEVEEEVNRLTILIERLNSLNAQIESYEKEVMDIAESTKDSIKLEADIHGLQEKISERKEQEKMLEELREKEKKALVALEKFNLSIVNSETIVNNIKEMQKCTTCGQIVDEVHKKEVIAKEKEKIEAARSERKKIEELERKIQGNISKVNRNIERFSIVELDLKKKQESLIKIQENAKHLIKKQKEISSLYEKKKILEGPAGKDIKDLIKEKEEKGRLLTMTREINLKLREQKNLLENLEAAKINLQNHEKESIDTNKENDNLKKKKQFLIDSLAGFEKLDAIFADSKEMLEQLKEKQKELEIKLATYSQEKKSLDIQIEEARKKLESLSRIKEELGYLSEIEKWFDDFFMNLMSTMEKHIMISVHSEFQTLLKEWFSTLIEDVDIGLDDEFAVKIIQDGYETSIESLSGGEKTSVALAYRLALNRVINDLIPSIKTKEFIILDEPTDGFSSEQLDKVRDVLEELGMKQTIIVSHEPKMESFVENIIRITKTDNISRAGQQTFQ